MRKYLVQDLFHRSEALPLRLLARALERGGALLALVLGSFPISLLTLLLFLETGKPPLERRTYHLGGQKRVRLWRFRTGDGGNIIGGLLERTGLAEAPILIDIATGRLSLSSIQGRRARLALTRSTPLVRR